jgi:2',3'-cyclic-nucleotide 2'-phosphodiesterase (5'-nucleotidase family)
MIRSTPNWPRSAFRPRAVRACVEVLALLLAIPAAGRPVALRVLCTSDLDGRVFPIVSAATSLQQLAPAVEAERKTAASPILVDLGGLFGGSPEAEVAGAAAARMAGTLAYDAALLSAADFGMKSGALEVALERFGAPVSAANVRVAGDRSPWPGWRRVVFLERDAVRIALIGLLDPDLPRWIPPSFLPDARWEDREQALAEVWPEVQAADVVIAMTRWEAGRCDAPIREAERWFERYPGLDLVLFGGLSEPLPCTRVRGGAVAGGAPHGKGLSVVDLLYDTVRKEVVTFAGRTVPPVPRDRLPPLRDPALLRMEQAARRYAREPVGVLGDRLEADPGHPTHDPVRALLLQAVREETGAEVALIGSQTGADLWRGPVDRRDLWYAVPQDSRIAVAHVTTADLRPVLEANLEKAGRREFLGCVGLIYWKDPASGRVEIRRPDGSPLHYRKRLRAAFRAADVASAGGAWDVLRLQLADPECRLEVLDATLRGMLEQWLRTKETARALREDGWIRDEP